MKKINSERKNSHPPQSAKIIFYLPSQHVLLILSPVQLKIKYVLFDFHTLHENDLKGQTHTFSRVTIIFLIRSAT